MPGTVSTVSTSQVSDDVVRVNWSAPEAVNGILQQYALVYREYDRPSSDVEVSVPLPAMSFDIPGLSEPIKFTANYALYAQYTCVCAYTCSLAHRTCMGLCRLHST